MINRECVECGARFVAQRESAKYCGDRCRKRAGRRPKPKPISGRVSDSEHRSPVEAVEVLLAEMRQQELLTVAHEVQVAALRGLANAVEADPGSPSLWREFRQAEQELRSLVPVEEPWQRLMADLFDGPGMMPSGEWNR